MGAVAPLLLDALAPVEAGLRGSLDDVRAALEEPRSLMTAAIGHHGAIKCAIDIALHDLAGQAARAAGPRAARGRRASCRRRTSRSGSTRPAVVAERASRAADFPALKIKVGGPADLETLEAVRAGLRGPDPRGRQHRLDAGGRHRPAARSWSASGVELIEQPFPARRLDQLRWLQERSPLPIVADESAVTIEDLDALVGVVDGVNVKLAKCGGVGPGAADARAGARARLPDVPRLHGGDVDRDRGVGGRLAARGVGRPRRLPAARRRPGHAAWSSAPDKRWRLPDRPGPRPGAAARGRPADAPQPDPAGAVRVHRFRRRPRGLSTHGARRVDKSVGNMVEKPLPAPAPTP